jgi:hypothetical protein
MPHRHAYAVLAALALATTLLAPLGCSSAPSGPCAPRSGTYSITFTRRDGDCGEIAENIQVFEQGTPTTNPTLPPNCSGALQNSTDNCATRFDVTCVLSNGARLTERGSGTWATDGSSGDSVEQVIVRAPDGSACSGTYDVRYRRIR